MWISNHPYGHPICITNTHLYVSINNIIILNIGTLALMNIIFKMQLAHIVLVNSLVMVNIPFQTHLALHVPIVTLAMVMFFSKCTWPWLWFTFPSKCVWP
jgi:hypothetical protein